MLQNLQGRSHEVYTGVAFLSYNKEGKKEVISHAVETKVHVHEMSEKEIREYVATKDPMDKAGGYGIQGVFAAYIDGIEGDYYKIKYLFILKKLLLLYNKNIRRASHRKK